MPLTRDNVTTEARIMLPAYLALAGFFGLLYLVDPQGRLQRSPGLTLARALLPMPAWGCIFLGIAVVMGAALLTHRRFWFILALYLYGACALMWAAVYLGATFLSPDASFGSPAWPLFVAVCCYAEARSLLRGERA